MKFNWTSKFVIICLIILIGFLAQQKFKQYRLQLAINLEKQNLQNKKAELEQKNQELEQALSYLNSPSYKEIVARQQLNMQKDGEIVYNITENTKGDYKIEQDSNANISNFQKWAKYFLKK